MVKSLFAIYARVSTAIHSNHDDRHSKRKSIAFDTSKGVKAIDPGRAKFRQDDVNGAQRVRVCLFQANPGAHFLGEARVETRGESILAQDTNEQPANHRRFANIEHWHRLAICSNQISK